MENGKLKIKASGKHRLKLSGLDEIPPPKEFVFDSLKPNTYDCEVLRENGTIIKILVDGKEIPKSQQIIEAKKLSAEQRIQKKEVEMRERLQNNNQRADSNIFSFNSQIPIDAIRAISGQEVDNFYLKLNKLAHFDEKFILYRKNSIEIKPNFNERNIEEISANHRNKAFAYLGSNLIEKEFKPDWRLIVGIGGASVYETGISLHYIYGFPYIPASSIKGTLRSYIIMNHYYPEFEGQEKAAKNAEDKALDDDDFVKIFGSQKNQGKVMFFDGFPTEKPIIEPDIMNPHYQDWYNGTKPPTDTQSPNPIFFLTVKNTKFQFLFGSKEIARDNLKIGDNNLEWWLTEALTHHGIGAKTSVGYGRMTNQ